MLDDGGYALPIAHLATSFFQTQILALAGFGIDAIRPRAIEQRGHVGRRRALPASPQCPNFLYHDHRHHHRHQRARRQHHQQDAAEEAAATPCDVLRYQRANGLGR